MGEVSPSLQLALSTIFKTRFENHLSDKNTQSHFPLPTRTGVQTPPRNAPSYFMQTFYSPTSHGEHSLTCHREHRLNCHGERSINCHGERSINCHRERSINCHRERSTDSHGERLLASRPSWLLSLRAQRSNQKTNVDCKQIAAPCILHVSQ